MFFEFFYVLVVSHHVFIFPLFFQHMFCYVYFYYSSVCIVCACMFSFLFFVCPLHFTSSSPIHFLTQADNVQPRCTMVRRRPHRTITRRRSTCTGMLRPVVHPARATGKILGLSDPSRATGTARTGTLNFSFSLPKAGRIFLCLNTDISPLASLAM